MGAASSRTTTRKKMDGAPPVFFEAEIDVVHLLRKPALHALNGRLDLLLMHEAGWRERHREFLVPFVSGYRILARALGPVCLRWRSRSLRTPAVFWGRMSDEGSGYR